MRRLSWSGNGVGVVNFALATLNTKSGERVALAIEGAYFRLDQMSPRWPVSVRAILDEWQSVYPRLLAAADQHLVDYEDDAVALIDVGDRHQCLHQPEGLARLASHLQPGGVFALWSNDPPDAAFEHVLASVFATSATHVVTFDNLRGDHDASNTVYVGVKADLPMPKAPIEVAPSAG